MDDDRRASKAWLLYDMGSSAYALSVGTLYYPIFFSKFAAQGKADNSHWAMAIILSTLLIGLTAPVVGAFADIRQKRGTAFKLTGWISVFGTLVLSLTAEMPVWGAVLLFVLIHVAFNLATNIYDSYISLYGHQDGDFSARSGTGWSLGYLGGLLCLGMILAFLGMKAPESQADFRAVFIICAIFYGAFSAYVFANLPEEREHTAVGTTSVGRLLATIKGWRKRKVFFGYVLATVLIVDGMTTALYFMSLYASDVLKYSMAQITILFVILQAVAVPATFLLSRAVRFVKDSMLVMLSCLVWMCFTALFVLDPGYGGMMALAALAGLVVGTTPALLRAIMGRLIEPESRAELFGFSALAGRVGAILGPLTYLVVLKTVGVEAAMLSPVPCFAMGSLIIALQSDYGRSSDGARANQT